MPRTLHDENTDIYISIYTDVPINASRDNLYMPTTGF